MSDQEFCHYCGVRLISGQGWQRSSWQHVRTKDHRTPTIRGGPNRAWNCVAACWSCNSSKGRKPYLDFVLGSILPRYERREIEFSPAIAELEIRGLARCR